MVSFLRFVDANLNNLGTQLLRVITEATYKMYEKRCRYFLNQDLAPFPFQKQVKN
jgi:hypothetical protein